MRGKTVLPQDYDVCAGLDVDKRSISVTFATHQGVIRSLRLPYSVEPLLTHVRQHFGAQQGAFAYEAGPTGYGLYDGRVAQADPCGIAAPSMIPRAPGQRGKTHRLDSVSLAENLRGGHRRSMHVPAPGYRELRHLTQLRDTVVGEMVRLKLRLKSRLLVEGLRLPVAPPGSQGSARGQAELRTLPGTGAGRFKLDQLRDGVAFGTQQVRQTTREIRRFCRSDAELSPCLQVLLTVPGVGWIVASQRLARIGDWRELKTVREVAGVLGVVPRGRSTGETIARGSITHGGDGRLRSKLVQRAWAAIRPDGERRECSRRVARTHPRDRAARVAIVAVARTLSGRLAAVLRQQRPYVVRTKVQSAPLTPAETVPQGTPRRHAEPGAATASRGFGN